MPNPTRSIRIKSEVETVAHDHSHLEGQASSEESGITLAVPHDTHSRAALPASEPRRPARRRLIVLRPTAGVESGLKHKTQSLLKSPIKIKLAGQDGPAEESTKPTKSTALPEPAESTGPVDTTLYCSCQQPYDARRFMIECSQCQDWFHGKCVDVHQPEAKFIERYVCPSCTARTNKCTQRRELLHKSTLPGISDTVQPVFAWGRARCWILFGWPAHHDAIVASASKVMDLLADGSALTLDRLRKSGFRRPILIEKPAGLDLQIPPHANVDYVVQLLGEDSPIQVIDVATQTTFEEPFSLREWADYLRVPPVERERVYNVISLEFTETAMRTEVLPPRVARQLDVLNVVWPDDFPVPRPEVQRYCLMGGEGAYTDFHVDLGGTSVWYHVVSGCKIFYLIPPTPENMERFEKWNASAKQMETCLVDLVSRVYRCVVLPGNTLLIPSGWIHAVYTPEDSFVYGGNYLHTLAVDMQLAVYDLETRVEVDQIYRYPHFELLHWQMARYVIDQAPAELAETVRLAGLQALQSRLAAWMVREHTMPRCEYIALILHMALLPHVKLELSQLLLMPRLLQLQLERRFPKRSAVSDPEKVCREPRS
ncbi:uncharacterized protein MONBRDRAFT_17694 [Monosiga brevicollis MX1]|uniref:Uncharacterized protein n=1 Tax=Monosiga brevicollis TaxID=81824 RepID=A9USV7_MONBE|nr:uncharacterized protein MONBRDRAFT_17694 [Monosiga brevicollis MX1]EDQ91844.1 predicted protein [Monosiga brevicollis MX1]|eukprot:XP_001743130.1 hypothetical protein [Monosiga brevicollis MX1]